MNKEDEKINTLELKAILEAKTTQNLIDEHLPLYDPITTTNAKSLALQQMAKQGLFDTLDATQEDLQQVDRDWILKQVEIHGFNKSKQRNVLAALLNFRACTLSDMLSDNSRKKGISKPNKAAFFYLFKYLDSQQK
jgi:hypothetical protein